jgi:hypothetical protein
MADDLLPRSMRSTRRAKFSGDGVLASSAALRTALAID